MSTAPASNVTLTLKVLSKRHKIKLSKDQLPTFRTFIAYAGVFTAIITTIGHVYQTQDGSAMSSIFTANVSAQEAKSSVDDVTALQVAGRMAARADLPVAANIANLSISLAAENKISQDGAAVINKPKIVEPMTGARSVTTYVAKDGDTPQSIADQFGVTAQTIKWANNLSIDTISAGTDITVPPIDGVVYTVKDGDAVDALAEKYKSDAAQIISFNDLELSGVKIGQRLVLPNGELPTEERPGYVAPVLASASPRISVGNLSATTPLVNGYSPITMTANGNAYAFGNCTSWAYERRAQLGHPVGSYWGNAATWDSLGRAAGYIVDKNPTVGSVFQMPAFVDAYTGVYGHVGIVESVNPDGSIYISEMNYAGNFNVVTYRTIPAAQAALYNYIH